MTHTHKVALANQVSSSSVCVRAHLRLVVDLDEHSASVSVIALAFTDASSSWMTSALQNRCGQLSLQQRLHFTAQRLYNHKTNTKQCVSAKLVYIALAYLHVLSKCILMNTCAHCVGINNTGVSRITHCWDVKIKVMGPCRRSITCSTVFFSIASALSSPDRVCMV